MRGVENAKHAQQIEKEAGTLKERRTHFPTRAIIAALIKQGVPIVSSTQRGYWITESPAELRRYALSLYSRAAEIRQRANDVNLIHEKMTGEKIEFPPQQMDL